jgi:CheY-like chemotaxis protein
MLVRVRPRAVILDIMLPGKDSWTFLTALKENEATRDIPILIVSAVEDQRKGLALGADVYKLKPITSDWLLTELTRLIMDPSNLHILIIDDEEMSRYILKRYLAGIKCKISEAVSGTEGLRKAREERPQIIFLDLSMAEMGGGEVLENLTANPITQDIPVIINTNKILKEDELTWFHTRVRTVLSKRTLSRDLIENLVQDVVKNQSVVGAT